MNIRFIPTAVHGVLDYVTSATLMAAPEVLGLQPSSPAALAPRLAGGGVAGYSLMTDYELGAVKLLPMPVHLMLDAAGGVLLGASPWLFGFAKGGRRYWLPHVLVGNMEILVALTTKTRPSYEQTSSE